MQIYSILPHRQILSPESGARLSAPWLSQYHSLHLKCSFHTVGYQKVFIKQMQGTVEGSGETGRRKEDKVRVEAKRWCIKTHTMSKSLWT